MAVSHEVGEVKVRDILRNFFRSVLEAHCHRHLGDAVEVDVVFSDELVDLGVLIVPPALPFILAADAVLLHVGLGE